MSESLLVTIEASAVGYLARREHSARQLTDKLIQKGFPPEDIADTLQSLQQRGLQSDQRFASAYCRARIQKGFGPRAIAHGLMTAGVSDDIVDETLYDKSHRWPAVLEAAWEKKYKAVPAFGDPRYQKQYSFLVQRGFEASMIHRFLQQHATDIRED